MSTNLLLKALQENDEEKGKKAKGYFKSDVSTIGYPTGFPTLDYRIGYRVTLPDGSTYNNLGIAAGTYTLIIGKSSTGKSSFVISAAANIIRPFLDKGGMIYHFDNERASFYTRIQSLTKFSTEEMENNYILRQDDLSVSDMKAVIYSIYKEKVENKEKYLYKSGKYNEFGKEIILPVPTVCILDSIANISEDFESLKDEENQEVSTQTDRLRLTGQIGRFFSEIQNFLKEANILLLAINHVKVNPQLGIVKSPSEMLYLKADETLSGGRTQYAAAHLFIKVTAVGSEKYNKEDEGFDGFLTRFSIIKSRTNADGKYVDMIYDKYTGHSAIRSTVYYLSELGLVKGNKNGYYFAEDEEKNKFTLANMEEDFNNNKKLYKLLYEYSIPYLESELAEKPKIEEYESFEDMNSFYS